MNTLIPPVLGIVGLIAAFVVYLLVMQYPDGEKKLKNWRSNPLRCPSIHED